MQEIEVLNCVDFLLIKHLVSHISDVNKMLLQPTLSTPHLK